MARSSSALRTEAQSFSNVASARYQRRRPETTVLYELVQNHLEAFLAESREKHGKPLPRYVEQEFRAYLKCGILSYGFLRARCSSCGEEIVVAFSCKKRGLCPSCNARRMCNTAAHLVDRVFPDVQVRQWVLSTPFELRFLLARRVEAFNQLMRVFADEVMRAQRRQAKELGLGTIQAAGVSFPQRFGSALQLNPHIHAVFCDGVFGLADAGVEASFHPLPPPDPQTLALICQRVHHRLCRWLRKKGLLRDEVDVDNNEAPELDPIESCTQGSLRIGPLARLAIRCVSSDAEDLEELEPLRPSRKSRGRCFGKACGFSIHAGVTAAAGNLHGRELLLRYCARPPLALGRLSKLQTGAFAYRLKKPWRQDKTHVVFMPLQLLARIAAFIPPPKSPLIRFHGAFAAHFRKRKNVIVAGTRARSEPTGCQATEPTRAGRTRPQENEHKQKAAAPPPPANDPARNQANAASLAAAENGSGVASSLPTAALLSVNTSVDREPSKNPWRIDWQELLKRVYNVDALACPCGGRLKFVELVTSLDEARSVLERMGLEPSPPVLTSRRSASAFVEPWSDTESKYPSAWDP